MHAMVDGGILDFRPTGSRQWTALGATLGHTSACVIRDVDEKTF